MVYEKNRCKINMTMHVDVTDLVQAIKENKIRCYPTFTYIASRIINGHDEFKMNYDEEGNLVVYDVVHPRYPIFHESDGKMMLPVSISVHHAVCDGFHVSRFFSEFQDVTSGFKELI